MKFAPCLAVVCVVGASAVIEGPAVAAPRTYSVIFDVTLDGNGKFVSATVSKVIDPAKGMDGVNVKIPDSYVAAATDLIRQRTFEAGREHVFVYYFYDPKLPNHVPAGPYG